MTYNRTIQDMIHILKMGVIPEPHNWHQYTASLKFIQTLATTHSHKTTNPTVLTNMKLIPYTPKISL